MQNICVIGTGYVGLVTALGLAEFGNTVVAVDNNAEKIHQLKLGQTPIFEPGVQEMLQKYSDSPQLRFETDIASALAGSTVIFIAVGTPMDNKGRADLQYVNEVINAISTNLSTYALIVTKSTVPVGTNNYIKDKLAQLTGKEAGTDFDIVSNPEFLREGRALEDFLHPDRVIIGHETVKARTIMMDTYRPLQLRSVSFLHCSLESAELIKYATNSFLAAKIAFINEMANLSEAVGANVDDISTALGLDSRISPHFLKPGPGYGGSCFPKDTRALVRMANEYDADVTIVKSVIEANENQKKRMIKKLLTLFNTATTKKQGLAGKTVTLLGLAFKPETDDVRESPAISIVRELIVYGAIVHACDPQSVDNFARIFPNIRYFSNVYAAAENTDALMVLTEWNEFRNVNFARLKNCMRGNVILDTRNVLDSEEARKHGFHFQGVGKNYTF
ncbi:MAG: UDP-glucose dehydrogenase family protein [Salinispira sp.]